MCLINFSSRSSLPTWLFTCRVLLALVWASYTSLSVLSIMGNCMSVPCREWILHLHLSSHPHNQHWQSVWEILLVHISVTVPSSVLSCATQLLLFSPWSCALSFFSSTAPPSRAEKGAAPSGHGQSLSRVCAESAPTVPQYLTLALTWKSYPFLGKAYCSCNMLAQQRSSSLWRDLAVFKMKYFFPFIHMNSCIPVLTSPLAKAGEQTESFPGVAFNKNNKTDLRGSKPHRKTCPFQNLK